MVEAIVPCLWFDHQAQEAAEFYTSIFKNSEIKSVNLYTKDGQEVHHQEEGSVMAVDFSLNGQHFSALNGGSQFKLTESISIQVFCETQEEIDYYWDKLSDGGEEQQYGWLKDKFELSWQIIPSILSDLMADPLKAGGVTRAFMKMKKFNIEKLKQS